MKFKSKIGDGLFISLVMFSIVTLAMFVVWVITGVWWPAITLTAILLIGFAPVYFCTYYEITRNELCIYCGIFGKSIEYQNIISMTDAESVCPSFALSHQRIMIRYMENEKIKSVYVSPANREQFRDVVNAEISKSTEVYKDAPKSAQAKAIEKARKEQNENPNLDKSELRAQAHAVEYEEDLQRKVLNKELGNLDSVIGANVTDKNNIRPVETVSLEQRKKAEQKLLAKIRKLKEKQDRKEAKVENKRNAEIARLEREKKQEIENLKKRKEQAEKAENKAKAKELKQQLKQEKSAKTLEKEPKAKEKAPETEEEKKKRLAHEKEELKRAIEGAKKDQIVPQKVAKNQAKTASAEIELEIAPKRKKKEITEMEVEQKPAKKIAQQKQESAPEQQKATKENKAVDEKTAKKQKTKEAKKEKVAEAKKSKAVVKNLKNEK